jgi:hypothetical protein
MSKSVAKPSAAVLAMMHEWDIASCLMGGTGAMREAGKRFLPKWPNEAEKAWAVRRDTATLYPAYKRTVETLSAKPFSKPITKSEKMDARIIEWLDDVDQEGRNIDAFSAALTTSAISHGLTGILVEYPVVPAKQDQSAYTVAEEKAMNLRPYFVHIKAETLLGWKAKRVGSKWKLMQLRIMETVSEPDTADQFTEKESVQVRVLEPGTWATWRKNPTPIKEDDIWIPHENGSTSLDYIPFVPVYGQYHGFMRARPPMIELGYLNIKHWQSQSDQDTILHAARVPILVRTGVAQKYDSEGNIVSDELTIGSSAAVDLPIGATLGYCEHTGGAIGAGQTSIADLQEQMRQSGSEMVLVNRTAQATATEVAIDSGVSMSHLQMIALGVEDAIDDALEMMGDYVGIDEASVGEVTLFNDFVAQQLSDTSATMLLTACTSGVITKETYYKEMQRRGIIAADQTWEDESAALDAQGPPPGQTPTPAGPKPTNVAPIKAPAAA